MGDFVDTPAVAAAAVGGVGTPPQKKAQESQLLGRNATLVTRVRDVDVVVVVAAGVVASSFASAAVRAGSYDASAVVASAVAAFAVVVVAFAVADAQNSWASQDFVGAVVAVAWAKAVGSDAVGTHSCFRVVVESFLGPMHHPWASGVLLGGASVQLVLLMVVDQPHDCFRVAGILPLPS